MMTRAKLNVVLTLAAATALAIGAAVPAGAAAGPQAYRIVNGEVCLDASYEFSVCQYGRNPDDPPSVQKWVLVPAAHGSYRIWNRPGTGWCLDVKEFDYPCSAGDSNQLWSRVPAGGGAYYVEHQSAAGSRDICLDVSWTFKACSRGDKNQIWTFRPVPGR